MSPRPYRDPRIQRVCTHPRDLWWVSYNHAMGYYSLVDAWKGEIATSDNSEALAAAVRLLTGWKLFSNNDNVERG